LHNIIVIQDPRTTDQLQSGGGICRHLESHETAAAGIVVPGVALKPLLLLLPAACCCCLLLLLLLLLLLPLRHVCPHVHVCVHASAGQPQLLRSTT
jgi:hypothetical protein